MLHLISHPGLALIFKYYPLPDGRMRSVAALVADLYPATRAEVAKAHADCSLEDRFNRQVGRELALSRLIELVVSQKPFGAASTPIASDIQVTYDGRRVVKQAKDPRDFRSGLRWLEVVCLARLKSMEASK